MQRKEHKENLKFFIGSIVIPIVCVLLTFLLTRVSTQKAIVQRLSTAFDFVDMSMSYEQALQSVYDKSEHDDKIIASLQQQIKDLKNGSNENSDSSEPQSTNMSKVDLFETKALYEGVCYAIYSPTDSKTFSMGSKTYNKGFVMYDDHSLFGEGDGYTLFDLDGKFSKMTFSVGRTNEYEKQDVTLKVYLNGEYVKEYSLSAESPPINMEIDLNYANTLKLEITGGSRVKYGFADVLLYY